MEKKYIYRCEDSAEGVFAAVYDAWASGHSHEENRIEVRGEWDESFLFAEYIEVTPDAEKSQKVQKTVYEKISAEAYDMVMKALLSEDSEKGEVIYRFLIYALKTGARACKSYGNPWTMRLFEIVRNYDNESHLLKGFLRFEERESGLLFAEFAPKNNILGDLMTHFSERLNTEDFIIYDKKRGLVGVHRKGFRWFVYHPEEAELRVLEDANEKTDAYGGLWRIFHRHIAIAERENRTLQRNNLPLRFRPYMTEFQ